MEKKNMVLLTVIAVATLLVAVVGATFAYFTATIEDNRTAGDGAGQGETNITAATVQGTTTATANIEGQAGSFTAKDVFPGHTEYAALSVKVTSTGEAKTVSIPFVYEVEENTIGEDIHYYLYRADSEYEDMYMGCAVETSGTQLSEKCDFRNAGKNPTKDGDTATPISELTLVGSGVVSKGENTRYQIVDELTTVNGDSDYEKTGYYYFVIEYKDNGQDQTADQEGKTLSGTLTVGGVKATP